MTPDTRLLRAGLPAELWDLHRFLLYSIKARPNGRPGKVPQRLAGTRLLNTSPLAPGAWLSLKDALDLLEQGHGDGLGLALLPDVGIVAADLDGVVAGQVIDPAAGAVIAELDAYTERSVSGRGLHVLVRGQLSGHRRKAAGLELIDRGFVALTGVRVPGTRPDVPDRQGALDRLCERQFGPQVSLFSVAPLFPVDDDVVVRRLLAARNGHRVRALLVDGCATGYSTSTASEVDFALARLIGWCTSDPEQVMRLMCTSPLCREKRWSRGDYLRRTVDRALALGYPARHLR
jgi:primase-polymerase (primpol)-like protein